MEEGDHQRLSLEVERPRRSDTPPVYSQSVLAEASCDDEQKKIKNKSEQHYYRMANAIPLIIWTALPNGDVNYYNQRWFEYTGLTFEQTRGRRWQTVLHPHDRQMCLERWQEAIHSGNPYEIEYRFRRADGVYRWYLGRALPVRDEQQQIIAWVGSDTDIDDQKRAEEELTIRVHQQAVVAELGQYALCGMELAELFEKAHLLVSQTLDVEFSSLTEMFDVGKMKAHAGAKEGTTQEDSYFLQSIANVLASATERKQAEMKLGQAMSALQEANVQLEHANKGQNDFVSIISHEFRSTLTSIQGFSELIRDEEFSFCEIKEYANDINTDARRLSRMINELLDFNRMKAGRMTFNPEQMDLNSVIRDVVERTNTHIHRISLQLDDDLPLFSGDRDKLTQVVTNLLNNAIKYSPHGGEIVLHSRHEDHLAHVWIQDQGVGIPAHALEQIFEPYVRVASGETKYIEGSGIGLAIVRQIIQSHSGKVWAENTPGEGSVFHFTLPL